MDPMAEEQLDYEDEEYGGGQKTQYQGGGAISALADEELMVEDDEYDDLYNDVNVGEGFLQLHGSEAPVSLSGPGNGELQALKTDVPGSRVLESGGPREASIPGVGMERKDSNTGASFPEQKKGRFMAGKGLEEGTGDYPDGLSQKGRILEMAPDAQVGNLGFRESTSMPPRTGVAPSEMPGKFASGSLTLPNSGIGGPRGAPQMPPNRMGMSVNANRPTVNEIPTRPSVENGTTMIFVGELHWWTTDAELESVLSQYGRVKEIKFFDERASGKSKGYCQVEFYDATAAAACKEGMNGHIFNGRACVVAFASPQTLKQMGSAYLNKSQAQTQSQPQGRRFTNEGVGRGSTMNYSGGDAGRNYGKIGWGRGGQGILNRGPGGGGPMRGRGGAIGAKNMIGSTGGVGGSTIGGGPYGQGLAGPALGGPAGGLMHPQTMMGAGFDPTFMGRGGGYGGFPGPAFPGMIPSFPAVNTMGLPGVAPHVNPAFFGRGMSANGMAMMGSSGMDGHHAGMWTDTSMGGWGGEEQGRRTRESSYGGDDRASDYGYVEPSHEKGGRTNAVSREKERSSERDWSGNTERRHRDEREQDWDRSDRDHRYREEKDGYRDSRQRDRDFVNEDDWDRGQSSRSRSRSHMMQEEDHRFYEGHRFYAVSFTLHWWLQLHLPLLFLVSVHPPTAGVCFRMEKEVLHSQESPLYPSISLLIPTLQASPMARQIIVGLALIVLAIVASVSAQAPSDAPTMAADTVFSPADSVSSPPAPGPDSSDTVGDLSPAGDVIEAPISGPSAGGADGVDMGPSASLAEGPVAHRSHNGASAHGFSAVAVVAAVGGFFFF
ncbi:hypothetical protein HHK36_015698 [Tetracentron sinense]|uniref:RRM domain-containing protein n=1 Tax=Tetracentron sinense TaxID=13715 RepID=A0A835DE49_TETSI|nr:hypothetical protein HHK36_015698 [Tetracentron sinense]